MPAYHIVLHTYGSWMPDHAKGYHDRKNRGTKPSNKGLADHRRFLTGGKLMTLSAEQQIELLNACKNSDDLKLWKVHAIAVMESHIHLILSWKSEQTPSQIQARLKQQLTHLLNSNSGQAKGRWFSRGAGIGRIRDMDHLVELVNRYIPQHGEHVWIAENIISEIQ